MNESSKVLANRYAQIRARLMGSPPPPVMRPIRLKPPEPKSAPEEPMPKIANANDNASGGLPLPAHMPLEEKAAALLALVPRRGAFLFPQLLKITARAFDISVRDLRSKSRRSQHVLPRQIAMVIALQVFGSSLPKVGRAFGGRDHTTVLHARNKFGDMVRRLIGAAIPPA
jgi:hypothetical protein